MKETVDELLKKTAIKPQANYGEDIVSYRNSIMIEMERESELEFTKEEGIEVGKMEVAREMKKKGMCWETSCFSRDCRNNRLKRYEATRLK